MTTRTYTLKIDETKQPSATFLEDLKTTTGVNSLFYYHTEPSIMYNIDGSLADPCDSIIKITNVPDSISDSVLSDFVLNNLIDVSHELNLLYFKTCDYNTVKVSSNIKSSMIKFLYPSDLFNRCSIIVQTDIGATGYLDVYNVTKKKMVCKFENISSPSNNGETDTVLVSTTDILNTPSLNDVLEIRMSVQYDGKTKKYMTLFFIGIY